jgi:diadenosine tetraphosphatase ApaH/serine/threonine PP2A family protein phosphatase
MSAPVIVTGFHRSGTSMCMQTLVRAGLHAGTALIGAASSNVDGHFEDIETVNLHDAWLAEAGSDWCHAGPLDSPHDSDAPDSVQRIMDRLSFGAQQDGSVAHGIKDPRAALFVDRWFNNAPDTVGVFVYRHYMSCLDSLRRRQADTLLDAPTATPDAVRFWSEPEAALASWVTHNQALLACMDRVPSRCVLVSQEALVSGFSLASLVNTELDIALNSDADTGVDVNKTVVQKQLALPESALALGPLLADVWNTLQARSHAPAADSSIPRITDNTIDSSGISEIHIWKDIEAIAGELKTGVSGAA